MALGFVGIFLPLLPTTPFLLLALVLFARSSPRWRAWVLRNKMLGPYVAGYATDVGLPVRAKVVTIAILWVTIGVSVIWFAQAWWLRILLLAIAAAVTVHILMKKTRKEN